MSDLTKSDLRNLAALPDGKWFEPIDVWPTVKRANYSLGRLVKAGYLEQERTGDLVYRGFKYRKIKDATGSEVQP